MGRIQQQLSFRKYRRFSDEQWLQVLLDSIDGTAPVPMPGFPDPELQAGFVGSAGETRHPGGLELLQPDERSAPSATVGRSPSKSQVLDFGCGWGRYARMFLRDVPADNIWCVDSWDLALQTCEQTGVPGRKVKIEQMPPSPLPSATFDTAFAYSVFSHLSPKAHLAWQEEFARVVKPGALSSSRPRRGGSSTTAGSSASTRRSRSSYWHDDSRQLVPRLRRRGRGVRPRRDALRTERRRTGTRRRVLRRRPRSPRILRGALGDTFEVLEFITDRPRFEQAVCIMRRR